MAKCRQVSDLSLTSDLSLPEGERYDHVERSEAASINAAHWLVAV